ncbi:MAG: hypothetical protein IT267_08545 [Saprospiraceae bacterium]|nr:hypothetical protein [Saprospiraceae bacterium]
MIRLTTTKLLLGFLLLISCKKDSNKLSLDQCLERIQKLQDYNISRLECQDFWEFQRKDYKVLSEDSSYYEFNLVQGLLLKSPDSISKSLYSNQEISKQVRNIIDSLKIVSMSLDKNKHIWRAEFLMKDIDIDQLWEICFNEKSEETINNIAGPLQYGCAVNRFSKFLYISSSNSEVNRNCYRFFKYKSFYFQICGIGLNDKDDGNN